MKKITAFLCVLVLLSAIPLCASATAIKDILPAYTFDDSMNAILGFELDGKIHQLPKVGTRIWLPGSIEEKELTLEQEENGIRYLFRLYGGNLILEITNYNLDMTKDQFVKELKANKFKDVTSLTINKQQCVLYTDPTLKGTICRVCAMMQEDGSITEYVFYYSSKVKGDEADFLRVITELIFASTRPLK